VVIRGNERLRPEQEITYEGQPMSPEKKSENQPNAENENMKKSEG